MGANVTCYVKVMVPKFEWRKISALTLEDARIQAKEEDPEVMIVLDASYSKEDTDG